MGRRRRERPSWPSLSSKNLQVCSCQQNFLQWHRRGSVASLFPDVIWNLITFRFMSSHTRFFSSKPDRFVLSLIQPGSDPEKTEAEFLEHVWVSAEAGCVTWTAWPLLETPQFYMSWLAVPASSGTRLSSTPLISAVLLSISPEPEHSAL